LTVVTDELLDWLRYRSERADLDWACSPSRTATIGNEEDLPE